MKGGSYSVVITSTTCPFCRAWLLAARVRRRLRNRLRLTPGAVPVEAAPVTFNRVTVPPRPDATFAPRTRSDINMTNRALSFIERLARDAPIRRFLEVGVYKGVTTTLLAAHGSVVAVDWFIGSPETEAPGEWNVKPRDVEDRLGGFLRNLDRMGVRDRVTVLSGPSATVLPTLAQERFGLVLIDADHSVEGARRDIVQSWGLIQDGGWLVLDDFSASVIGGAVVPSVRRAWELARSDLGIPAAPILTADDDPPKTVAVRKIAR